MRALQGEASMSEALKTRTLARLYLEQGHPHRARRIVRELLLADPGDAELNALLAQANEAASHAAEKEGPSALDAADDTAEETPEPVNEGNLTRTITVGRRPEPLPPQPESLRDRALELGAAVVDHLAGRATDRLSRLLNRIRERRR
jgi:hypothetical protein